MGRFPTLSRSEVPRSLIVEPDFTRALPKFPVTAPLVRNFGLILDRFDMTCMGKLLVTLGEKMTKVHLHHIIPRYAGGNDDSSNLIALTPIQHAMWHYASWMRLGDCREFCSYKMLLGDINNPEFRKAAAMRGGLAMKRLAQTEEGQRRLSENGAKAGKLGNKAQRNRFKQEGRTIAEKTWLITTPSGEQFQITNLAKFCRENGLSKCHLSAVSKGKRKHHRGYKVEKLDPVD